MCVQGNRFMYFGDDCGGVRNGDSGGCGGGGLDDNFSS